MRTKKIMVLLYILSTYRMWDGTICCPECGAKGWAGHDEGGGWVNITHKPDCPRNPRKEN